METLKVHAYFVCYNESLILPHMLKYYSSFCERIVIIDNYSTDESIEICKKFKNVNVYYYDSENSLNDSLYVKIKNNCWKSSRDSCDFVIVADCDEFLFHRTDIKKYLLKAKELGVTILKPNGYHMVADSDFNINDCKDIVSEINEGVREQLLDKYICFDPNKIQEMNYGLGCHLANPVGDLKLGVSKSCFLKHYKFVGMNAYVNRSIEYGKRMSEFNKINNLGNHYLRDVDELEKDYLKHLQMRKNIFNEGN